jgi:PKD repeat protein
LEKLESRELFDSTPLNDLGTGTYEGYTGGLYLNGADNPPAATQTYAQNLAQNIVPLNSSGSPDPHGLIGMVSVGMSNASMEFSQGSSSFMGQADADPAKNPQLVIVNGAEPGMDAPHWVDPTAKPWIDLQTKITSAGLTAAQVQVAWVKEAIEYPYKIGGFPVSAQALQTDLEDIARDLLTNFPNIKIAYFSSRTHAYTTDLGSANPEPWAYEGGFAVQWMMQDQINGTGNMNYDPSKGTVVAPLVLWGPYLWATSTPRSDGFTWDQSDVISDDIHPSASGIAKVGNEMISFFKTDATTTPWFLAATPSGQGPVVTASGSVTSGTAPLTVNFTASATDPGGGTITQYAWTYNDGDFSLDQNPTKILDVPGTYNVHLTVSDSLGYTTVTTIQITVTASSSVAVSSSNTSSNYGQQITLTATVSPVPPATGTPTGTVQFIVDGADVGSAVTLSGGTGSLNISSIPAGTHTVQAVYSGDSIFTGSVGTMSGNQTVSPVPLTITADNQSMVYGGTMPTLTASYQGFVNGDTSANLTTQSTLSTVPATSHAGTYTITASGAVDPNYTISYATGALTITPAPLTITADNHSMVYGGTLPTLTATYTGLVNGDTAATFGTSPNTPPSFATVPATSAAGSYIITVSGAVDPDYTISYTNGTLTITPAPLTISANNQNTLVGAPLPAFTASYQGFVNGDTAASLTTPPTFSTTATTSSPVGAYPITVGGATDANYTITFTPGTLTVGHAGTSTTVTPSVSSALLGQSVTFTAVITVTAPGSDTPGGAVQFQVNGTNSGDPVNVTSTSGVVSATLTTTTLPVGRPTVTALYSGDGNFLASQGYASIPSGTDNQRWVNQIYQDLLNRPVDSSGLDTWAGALDQGVSRSQIALDIEASGEYLTDVVQGYYQKYLHRAADPGGLNSWVSFLEAGATFEQVEADFAGSTEYFQNRGGGTTGGFLNALFQDALGRPVDPSGQSIFSSAMANGATASQVSAAIFASDEFRQDLIQADFVKFLHRPVDPLGLTAFLSALRSGATDQSVAALIVGSGEYFSNV